MTSFSSGASFRTLKLLASAENRSERELIETFGSGRGSFYWTAIEMHREDVIGIDVKGDAQFPRERELISTNVRFKGLHGSQGEELKR
jgi:hypothetical protein